MKLIPLQSCTLYIQRKQFMSRSFNFAYLFTGLPLKANWTNCSKLGPGLEFIILGCSSTHNRFYREQQWVPHLWKAGPTCLSYQEDAINCKNQEENDKKLSIKVRYSDTRCVTLVTIPLLSHEQ